MLCEYNRRVKKRGKGSDLYPTRPRKSVKKSHNGVEPTSSSNGINNFKNNNNIINNVSKNNNLASLKDIQASISNSTYSLAQNESSNGHLNNQQLDSSNNNNNNNENDIGNGNESLTSSSDYPILRGPRPRPSQPFDWTRLVTTGPLNLIPSFSNMSNNNSLNNNNDSNNSTDLSISSNPLASPTKATSLLPQLGSFLNLHSSLSNSSLNGSLNGSTGLLDHTEDSSEVLDNSLVSQKNSHIGQNKDSDNLNSSENDGGHSGNNNISNLNAINTYFPNTFNTLLGDGESNNNFENLHSSSCSLNNILNSTNDSNGNNASSNNDNNNNSNNADNNNNNNTQSSYPNSPNGGLFGPFSASSISSLHNPLHFNVALLNHLTSNNPNDTQNLLSSPHLNSHSNVDGNGDSNSFDTPRVVPSFSAQPFKLSSLGSHMQSSRDNKESRNNNNSNSNSDGIDGGNLAHNSRNNEDNTAINGNNNSNSSTQWIINSFFDKSGTKENGSGQEQQKGNGRDIGHNRDNHNVSEQGMNGRNVHSNMNEANNSMNNVDGCDSGSENGELIHGGKAYSEKSYTSSQIYPVLAPIIKEINYLPPILAAEFMQIYFTNSVYSIAPILRRYSMLRFDSPRRCSPALLYSILYVSAHASKHAILTSGSEYTSMLIAKLLESTLAYLEPLRNDHYSQDREIDLDDVIAYINIGIVDNATNFKPESMKWWAMAVTLARSLKLNKEIPTIPEEAREERRRTWWSLFMIDRHLALCFNRPCMILDSECLELFFPVSKNLWDSGVVVRPGQSSNGTGPGNSLQSTQPAERLRPPEGDRNRRRGLQCTVVEAGLFGMYLPLMTLLGGIIELHFFELSPLFSQFDEGIIQNLRESYKHRLKTFQYSLEEFYAVIDTNDRYLMAWGEYCECLIQVFYILLQGYWDPTSMLDDIDVLLNNQRFNSCLRHSLSASTHVDKILRLDPELQTIPFFFGIQLLQAGFIPFCMSERYGSHTSRDVAQACRLFLRAHEVAATTLNTQYQNNFRALLQGIVRDTKHTTVSVNERIVSTNRRRMLMSMYRWNAGGTGLAVWR